jgi:16S rRNA (cytidine1402-2'-O)-methyltransferase
MINDAGCLYIVATPIGNLQDITLRALDILRTVDRIACEDTRHTLKLLNSFSISKKLISCRSGNEEKAAERIISMLDEGLSAAYVSDAGTPGLSDPGGRLVRAVRDSGYPVIPIPGPSAFASLVSVAAFPDKAVTFEGFLSPKPGRRRKRLRELLERQEAVIIYESPFRIIKLLTDIADLFPEREILVGREMTKIHEEFLEGPVNEVLELLNGRENVKGEFSVLVSGKKKS